MTEILAAIVGALLGGLVALIASFSLGRKQERNATTHTLIAEFMSDAFLEHRISVYDTLKHIEDGTTTYDDLAGGYWYRGQPSYSGVLRGALNEHQHLEAYKGFLVKLDFAIRAKRVNVDELANALGSGMVWHREVILGLADATESQASAANAAVPRWVEAVRRVSALMQS